MGSVNVPCLSFCLADECSPLIGQNIALMHLIFDILYEWTLCYQLIMNFTKETDFGVSFRY